MAKLRLIKRRIKTTQNIAKITRAMEMVAALKMKRAQDLALRTRPYTEKATRVLFNLLAGIPSSSHPLFSSPKMKEGKIAMLLIAPNRGLCGSLSTNLFRELHSFSGGKDTVYLSYGRRGRDFLTVRSMTIVADFEAPEPPSFEKAVDIVRILSEGFLAGKFSEVHLAYTLFEGTMRQNPVILPFLPLEKEASDLNVEYLFEPGASVLFDAFVPHFLEIKIYHSLLEAYASEQSARMMAMRQATDNAREIMRELTLSYNEERQQVITNEISDIITAKLALEVA